MADTVARLMRLRAAEIDAARRDVAAAVRAQAEAEARLAQAQRAIGAEAGCAPADAAHPLAGSFARWLPAGQAAIQRLGAEDADKRAALDAARRALAHARAALRACEIVQDTQAAARREAALKAAQADLEDVARRR